MKIPLFSLHQNLVKRTALLLGIIFLIGYWLFGYDGITFSDEVTYLQLGHQLWNNETVVSDYHLTSRWGAFLFSGIFTHVFGFSDRYASLVTLGFYLLCLLILWKITPPKVRKWAVLFFLGHIYLLHFLTKVYPDGFLILWVILIPASAIYREKHPVPAALVMALAFFIGFCTKETIVFLFPFPLLLFLLDFRNKKSLEFYYYFIGLAALTIVLYLGYYQWRFGDWLYRFKNIHDGHYISDYSYHDKGWLSIIKRISYAPVIDLADRTYWLWLVMAIPGIYYGIKNNKKIKLEFALCCLCLLVGFWFMTTSFQFYNPLPLNPRHLIIVVAPLAVCIALGARHWLYNQRWRNVLAALLAMGSGYPFFFGDWKIGLFYLLFAGLLFLRHEKLKFRAMAFCLIFPAIFSLYYQHQLKNYPHFLKIFQTQVGQATKTAPLITHDFVYFSREVLLGIPGAQPPVISLHNIDSLKQNPPESLTVLVYNYYRHAYPAEQEYLDHAEAWLDANYRVTCSSEDKWIRIRSYSRQGKN